MYSQYENWELRWHIACYWQEYYHKCWVSCDLVACRYILVDVYLFVMQKNGHNLEAYSVECTSNYLCLMCIMCCWSHANLLLPYCRQDWIFFWNSKLLFLSVISVLTKVLFWWVTSVLLWFKTKALGPRSNSISSFCWYHSVVSL